jgi:hypothetical protein
MRSHTISAVSNTGIINRIIISRRYASPLGKIESVVSDLVEGCVRSVENAYQTDIGSFYV